MAVKFEELRLLKQALNDVLGHCSLEGTVNYKLNYINSALKDKNFDLTQIEQMYYSILNKNNEILKAIQDAIENVDQQIIERGLESSIEHEHNNSFNEERLLTTGTATESSPELELVLERIIKKYTGWQYPSLYFSVNNNNSRLDHMSATEPLYILGPTQEHLQSWVCGYPDVHRRRLRLYALNQNGFDQLPKGQFGFIICWDYFPLLTIGLVKSYVQQLTELLRPGGILLFNYSNAELRGVADQVDQEILPWASKSYLKKLVNSLDLKVVDSYDFFFNESGNSTSWFLIEKEGTLKTSRRSSVLGEILTKELNE